MKKICFFLPTLNFGGIEANTIRLANSFVESGYDVDLVIGNVTGEYLNRIDKKINVISINKKTLISMLLPLVRYIKQKKPSVIITGGEGANILLCTTKLFVQKTKIIISIRTNLTNEYKESNSMKKKLLFPFLSRRLYKKANRVVAVSEGVANDASEFLKIPRDKLKVIYNPILDNSLIKQKNEKVTHKWLVYRENKVVISVGRLVKAKDYLTLIQSFKVVKEKLSNVKLLILGEGPEREKIQAEINKYNLNSDVEIVGFVQNPYSYMSNADLFVLSSKWEGFGNVIVEALATGIPVVSTNCPSGPSEILNDGEFGSLVPVGNVEIMSKEIISSLSNNNEKKIYNRENRAKDFSVEVSKDKYINLIEKLFIT